MTRFKVLGAVAVVASALASPAMAQQVVYNPGYCAQFYPNANCQNKGPGSPYTGDYQRQLTYRGGVKSRDANADWTYSWNDGRFRSGFWPGDVAAGVVGGAVGTAGAIATAPFRGDSYAYYNNGDRGRYGQSYAERNGLVCTPGTWFRGDDGRRHRCR